MASRTLIIVARLLWLAPALLLLLSINQIKVAYDLHHTLAEGTPAIAEVLAYGKVDRADVTFAFARLRVPIDDQHVIERELPLPLSLIPQVEGRETVNVLVLPGAAQEVVIEAIARPQWRMAAINAAMSFGAFLIFFFGVLAWNRYLTRRGDPAVNPAASPAEPVA